MPKYPPKTDNHSHSKKPYSQPSGRPESSAVQTNDRPQRRGPKPPPSAPVISKPHKDQQAQNQPQSLDLTGKSLTEPPNLSKEYPRLGKLNLTDCGLTSITFVSQVRNTLTWLNLSGNKLMDSSAWEGIEQLKSLYGECAFTLMSTEVDINLLCGAHSAECESLRVSSSPKLRFFAGIPQSSRPFTQLAQISRTHPKSPRS